MHSDVLEGTHTRVKIYVFRRRGRFSFSMAKYGRIPTSMERKGRPTIVSRVTFPMRLYALYTRGQSRKPCSEEFQTIRCDPEGFQLPTTWDVLPPRQHNPSNVPTD